MKVHYSNITFLLPLKKVHLQDEMIN